MKESNKVVVDIPDQVLVEILSWVPAKILMRLRCVCKSWNSLVLDPIFAKLHFQRSSKDTPSLFSLSNLRSDGPRSIRFFSVDRLLDDPSSTVDPDCGGVFPVEFKYIVVGTCNGLVCLRDTNHEFQHKYEETRVQFWNPITGLRSNYSPCIRSLFRDVKMGFGYDESSDTYKVVALVVNTKTKEHESELRVHSLGDNCWRKVADVHVPRLIIQFKGQYLSGTLNWAVRIDTQKQFVIFSFDVRSETHKYLKLPVEMGLTKLPQVGVLKDCLCLFNFGFKTYVNVWQMKEFGVPESWTLLMEVSYQHFEFSFGNNTTLFCGFVSSHVLLLGNNCTRQFVLCDLSNKRIIRSIHIPGNRAWFNYGYVPSLVLPYAN